MHRGRIGNIGRDADAAELFRRILDAAAGAVEQSDFSAGIAHRAGRRETDRTGAAGHHRDLSGQRFFDRAAELRLFERPVLHLEQLGFRQRLEGARRPRHR